MDILFFDADKALEAFLAEHPQKSFTPILFTKDFNATPLSKLKDYFEKTEIISLFPHSEMVSNEKLDKFPNLKLIATRSTGYNHIDLSYCKKRGICVVNVPRYGEVTVAEFAMGLMLALSRKIIRARHDMAANRIRMSDYVGFDLMGKTLGVIGTGSIGSHVIKLAQAFGMNVLAYDLYPKKEFKNLYVKSPTEIYKKSDIISLHVPSTPENVHLLNKKAFDQMKEGVIIINTARGDLIDTQALYHALKSKKVGGAGLDVLENEDFLLHDEIMTSPQLKNPEFLLDSAMNFKLLQLKNVIATPHVAFNSVDAVNRILQTTMDNISGFLSGHPVNRCGEK